MSQKKEKTQFEYTHRSIEQAVKLITEEPERSPIGTGFEDLDHFIGGLKPGEVIVLGGRPSMGKTAFALSIAEHVSIEEQHACLYYSMDMTGAVLMRRLIRQLSGMVSIKPSEQTDEEKKRIRKAADRIKASPFIVVDKAYPSINWIVNNSHRYSDLEVKLIVIDFFQLISGEEYPATPAEGAEIIHGIKQMALEMNCTVIVLSQLTRAVEERDFHWPGLTDLRDYQVFIDLEDTDTILFLYRDDYYYRPDELEPDEREIANIIIARQKHGMAGTVRARFNTSRIKFVPINEEIEMYIPDEADIEDAFSFG